MKLSQFAVMTWKEFFLTLGAFFWLFISFPLWYLVLVGLWGARELWSYIGILVYASIFLLPFAIFSQKKCKWKVVTVFVVIAIVGFSIRFLTIPSEVTTKTSQVETVFLDGASPLKYSLWSFFSERDLIRIGSYVILGFFPEGRNKELYDGINKKYDMIEQDQAFGPLWSEYVRTFDDMILVSHPGSYYYRYTPKGGGDDRLVVYMHGAMGNFMMYPWMFRDLSETSNSTMTYVSFGYGEWSRPGGVETVKKVIDNELANWKTRHPKATKNPEITLVALSLGGTGLSRFVLKYPGVAKYVVPISAVLEKEVMDLKSFRYGMCESNFLIFHGMKDENVPIEGVYYLENLLKTCKTNITKTMYRDGADHFAMFDYQSDFDAALKELWKTK